LKDYRELRAKFLREQLFKSSKVYYVLKTLSNAAILAASIALICVFKSYWAVVLSASLLGLFVQQCGWLSHDFLHHQVWYSWVPKSAVVGQHVVGGNLWVAVYEMDVW
jgi:hypothetical protein